MKKTLFFITMTAILFSACQPKSDTNPFFEDYDTPFGVPPFDKIKVEHYVPAFEEGIKQQQAEIDAITSNQEAPTFENTILAYDKSGEILSKVSRVFYNMSSALTNEDIQSAARIITPMTTKHRNNMSMNMELFKRVKAVYEKRNESGLNDNQIRVVEKYFRDFERSGATLNEEDQSKLKEINNKLSMLSLKFGDNHRKETNDNFRLVIENKEDLAGLPDAVIAGGAETAKELGMEGKWVYLLQKPSMIPFLQYAENRALREKIYRGYFMRGNNGNEFDNKDIIEEIAALRAEKAKLLGFETHADYVIDNNMAKTPENVYDFLGDLWKAALPIAKKEVKEMQAIIDKEGGNFKLASWDWWYYAEKLRKEKYDLDEAELKPYLKLDNVRDGMFWVATQLYGITFTKLNNVPVYHEDVEVFEVKEADGQHVGLLFLDYFPRSSKGSGAWCTSYRSSGYDIEGNRIYPLSSIVCNFTKPTEDLPSLLTWDETTTLFHEFGHALHGLFTDGLYSRTAGSVPRDYVELPSQIMENWAGEPAVLKQYAKHYETGEAIPDELIEKIVKSGHFNQGFMTSEYLAASFLDLDWHSLKAGETVEDAQKFEEKSMNNIGLIEEIIPRYRSTYFSHIFSGGYSAGYYVYIWAAVLDADAFYAFKESGDLFNKELADKFREHCLSKVGDGEGMDQYFKFRGKNPDIQALRDRRGLN